MGLDADQLMYCPYGEDHPTYDRVREAGGEIPFCYHLDRQRNKTMADWLLPYLAKKWSKYWFFCLKFEVFFDFQFQVQKYFWLLKSSLIIVSNFALSFETWRPQIFYTLLKKNRNHLARYFIFLVWEFDHLSDQVYSMVGAFRNYLKWAQS